MRGRSFGVVRATRNKLLKGGKLNENSLREKNSREEKSRTVENIREHSRTFPNIREHLVPIFCRDDSRSKKSADECV